MFPLSRMSCRIAVIACCLLALAMPVSSTAADDGHRVNDLDREFAQVIQPLLVQYCHDCHTGDGAEAKVDLASFTSAADLANSIQTLKKLYEAVDGKKMPPEEAEQPADEERERLSGFFGGLFKAEVAAHGGHVSGFVPSREQREWWSFQPLADVEPPSITDSSGQLREIDRFIRDALRKNGLQPSPPADRRTLLRRAKFALTGLPPTPEEMGAFLRDESADAFERVVDRWLASPLYGQHLGRQWLDVVRYTDYLNPQPDDVKGPGPNNMDFEFYSAYRYRDWVVDAMNRDMPFDEFIIHQLAGDQLPSPTGAEYYANGLIATTVLAIGVWDNGDADKEKIVSDIVDDQINLVGKAFLGLTLSCSRCHDHKFDPVSTDDYYGLAGIFYSTRILDSLGPVGLHTNALRVPLATNEYVAQRDAQLAEIEELKQQLGFDGAQGPNGTVDPEKQQLQETLANLESELMPAPPTAMAAVDGGTPGGLFPQVGDVPVHRGGRYDNLGEVVPRHLPTFFCGTDQTPITRGSGRAELATWLASPENPLTPRVIVNRIWQHLFGRGLVGTTNNFGLLGETPSHPELLDWLTARFIEEGWSIKWLIRTMMGAQTYQQSSGPPPEVDPDNRLLSSFAMRRLSAEEIRDSMLIAAGTLERKMGGRATQDLNRPWRSLYIQTNRSDRRNFSTLFDAADPEQCVGTRRTSTIAPQALFFLNNDFVHRQAAQIAQRLERKAPDDERYRIERAYQLLFGRLPEEDEVSVGLNLLAKAAGRDPAQAWSEYVHVLLCSNEFCYVD